MVSRRSDAGNEGTEGGNGATLVLASPRGFCAGVRRAVEIAEGALSRHGRPIYCLNELVHNRRVVERLSTRGVVFVRAVEEVPKGSVLLFSAHGVPPDIRRRAADSGLEVIDATCPFVNKVHAEVRRFAARGCTVFLIGRRGHDEIVGVAGEAPESVVVVESVEEVSVLNPPDASRVAVVTQTTLSQSDTECIREALAARFPSLISPETQDICYATRNRQEAVRDLARRVRRVLVLGSENSSNSRRLVEVARAEGVPAELVTELSGLDCCVPEVVPVLGLTAGASAPDDMIAEAVARLREMGYWNVVENLTAVEDFDFREVDRKALKESFGA